MRKMRIAAILLLAALLTALLGGCAEQRYTSSRYDLFDTEIDLICCGVSAREAERMSALAFERLERLHRLCDIYHSYDGMTNLHDLNAAGGAPVGLNEELTELLTRGKDAYALTGGRVNIALGSVLALWHEARERGVLPTEEALRAAAEHCDIEDLRIDAEKCTVTLTDPALRLDVGALAKGWAVGKTVETLRQAGYDDFILSAGGNVAAMGSKNGKPWEVAVQSPDDPSAYAATVQLSDLCAVTSGGYQRYVEIGGRRYHHLIDPDTLMPGDFVRSATVICADSALADVLSTACFLLPPDEAMALAENNDARLILVDETGAVRDSAANN